MTLSTADESRSTEYMREKRKSRLTRSDTGQYSEVSVVPERDKQ